MSQQGLQNRQRRRSGPGTTYGGGSGGLQVLLWTLWTSAVLGWGYLQLQPTLVAETPADLIGLVVECVLVGAIGLVMMTLIEMRQQPWRFLADGDQ